MISKPILTLTVLCFICSSAIAQELHEWKSNTGHSTMAALLKIDESSRKITLLIPKEIDFDKLDAASLALARKLASAQDKVSLDSAKPTQSEEFRFLQSRYEELTKFKASKEFAELGFSIGSPFKSWLSDVEQAKENAAFGSDDVAFALAHLLTLGLEYKDSKGFETEYARFANECIKGILEGKSKDEFEKRALAKIESILHGKTSSQKLERAQSAQPQPIVAEYKYVQDDLYPDIYAFRSIGQLKHYWQLPRQSPNLTPSERGQLGIELIESKTRIRIVSRMTYDSATIFEVEPTTGRQKGKRLFVISLDVYDRLR